MTSGQLAVAIISFTCFLSQTQAEERPGGESPEAVVARMGAAMEEHDYEELMACLTTEAEIELSQAITFNVSTGAGILLAAERMALEKQLDTADLDRNEIETVEKSLEALVDEYLRPPPGMVKHLSEINRVSLAEEFLSLLEEVLEKTNSAERFETALSEMTMRSTELTAVEVDGATATGRVGEDRIAFKKVDGRWFIDLLPSTDSWRYSDPYNLAVQTVGANDVAERFGSELEFSVPNATKLSEVEIQLDIPITGKTTSGVARVTAQIDEGEWQVVKLIVQTEDSNNEIELIPKPSREEMALTEIEAQFALSREDRVLVQLALAALGYDVGVADGVIGQRTRKAIKQYQSKNRESTGYLNATLAETLVADGREIRKRVRRVRDVLPRVGGYSDTALAVVLTHPSFQGAPQVALRSYGYKQTFPNDPKRSPVTGAVSYDEIWGGLVHIEVDGQAGPEIEALTSVGGQMWLSQRIDTGEGTDLKRRSITITDVSGALFPIKTGNRFAYTRTYATSAQPKNEQRTKVTLKVVERLRGKSIDPLLPGDVYRIVVRQAHVAQDRTTTWETYYNKQLGMALALGLIESPDPQRNIILELTDLQLE